MATGNSSTQAMNGDAHSLLLDDVLRPDIEMMMYRLQYSASSPISAQKNMVWLTTGGKVRWGIYFAPMGRFSAGTHLHMAPGLKRVNPLLPNGGGFRSPLSVFHKYLFLLSEFCSVLLCIHKYTTIHHSGFRTTQTRSSAVVVIADRTAYDVGYSQSRPSPRQFSCRLAVLSGSVYLFTVSTEVCF